MIASIPAKAFFPVVQVYDVFRNASKDKKLLEESKGGNG